MALLVTNLAFTDDAAAEMAKLGVMVGSVVAAVAGYAILRSARQSTTTPAERVPES